MSRPPTLSLLQPLCPECAALTPVQRRMDVRGWGYTHICRGQKRRDIYSAKLKHAQKKYEINLKNMLYRICYTFLNFYKKCGEKNIT